ncbi:hypothetical protein [Pseudoalteromonas citrea]|nr:hypothetical protein [Pseudoalteromonas citrea]
MNLLHDIKLDNGSIITQCYPNETLGNFVSYHHGNVIDARTIHQIRLSQEQLPVLLTKEQKEG